MEMGCEKEVQGGAEEMIPAPPLSSHYQAGRQAYSPSYPSSTFAV